MERCWPASTVGSRIRNALSGLLQPRVRFRIARRTPIASRRERPSRADLRCIRQTGSLELAELKKSVQEYFQPSLDLTERVLLLLVFAGRVGPGAARPIAPRVLGHERDLAGPIPETADVVQIEVLQLERSDDSLGQLRRSGRRLVVARNQPGRDLRLEDR